MSERGFRLQGSASDVWEAHCYRLVETSVPTLEILPGRIRVERMSTDGVGDVFWNGYDDAAKKERARPRPARDAVGGAVGRGRGSARKTRPTTP